MDGIQKRILLEVADLHGLPHGAYNFRINGVSIGSHSSEDIEIHLKPEGNGLDVHVRPGTKNQSVHIPVVLSRTGLEETVYNDFYIGAGSDVLIVAGCGIHNGGGENARHDGIHRFYIEEGARMRYVEKHYGEGEGTGQRILNPLTELHLAKNSTAELEMVQIRGVDSTERITNADLAEGAKLLIQERLMTHGRQEAVSLYNIALNGENSAADVVSRSVAKDDSYQKFDALISGNAACKGHSECDAIIMDKGCVLAIPQLEANNVDAALIHEAAIGKIAGDQLIKLMTLGLTEAEAEEQIINGFLK